MTTDQPSVVVALSRVMQDVQAVAKGDRNSQQGYSFRGVDAVMNAVGPVLRKHGVVVLPVAVETNYRDVSTVNGKPSRECTVKVKYRFYGPAGDYLDAEAPGESMDFGDKGAPKAMSVAYRILLLQSLCLPTHEPEPDAATYERAAPANGRTVGRGDAPAEPPKRTAADARAHLAADAKRNGWDLDRIADLFAAQHEGRQIAQAENPQTIDKFREGLYAVSDQELRAQPAANGAAQ
ncbi:MAG: ERF family protein [Acidimicrobiia bacterium]